LRSSDGVELERFVATTLLAMSLMMNHQSGSGSRARCGVGILALV
jgi:hypothetical protein